MTSASLQRRNNLHQAVDFVEEQKANCFARWGFIFWTPSRLNRSTETGLVPMVIGAEIIVLNEKPRQRNLAHVVWRGGERLKVTTSSTTYGTPSKKKLRIEIWRLAVETGYAHAVKSLVNDWATARKKCWLNIPQLPEKCRAILQALNCLQVDRTPRIVLQKVEQETCGITHQPYNLYQL